MSQITDRPVLNTTPAGGDLLIIRDVSDTTDKPDGTDKQITLSTLMEAAPGSVLHNFTASATPTAGDDSDAGYTAESLWYVSSGADAGKAYVCVDDTNDAAVWVRIDTAFGFTESQDSIEDATDGIRLVGDEDAPDPHHVYGTDEGGNRGWIENRIVMTATTSDDTETEMLKNGSDRLVLPDESCWDAFIKIVGREQGGGAGFISYWRRCLIARETGAANTSLIGSVATVDTDIDSSPDPGWSVDVVADTTNGALQINVTGAAATNVDWKAEVQIVEVAE